MSKEVLKFILFILATLTTAISGYQSGAPATGDEEESPKRRGRPAKAKPSDDEDDEDEEEEDEEEDDPKKGKGKSKSMFEEEAPKRRGRPAKAKPSDDEDDEDEDDEDDEEDEITDAVLTAKAKKYIADGGTRAELKKLIVKYIKKGDEPLVPNVAENKRPAFLAELQKMTKAL